MHHFRLCTVSFNIFFFFSVLFIRSFTYTNVSQKNYSVLTIKLFSFLPFFLIKYKIHHQKQLWKIGTFKIKLHLIKIHLVLLLSHSDFSIRSFSVALFSVHHLYQRLCLILSYGDKVVAAFDEFAFGV